MKKISMLLLTVLLGSAALSVSAKKEKKVVAEPVPAPVSTSNDSLSYAFGMAHTNGLIPYLLQNKMDTAYMADFVAGFKEAIAVGENPSKGAYIMGMQIAQMLNERMLPDLQSNLAGTSEQINRDRFVEGFIAGVTNDTTIYSVDNAETFAKTRMEQLQEEKQERLYGKNREEGKQFLVENAQKEGVVTLPSGLQYKVIVKGEGAIPTVDQEVTVKYEGKLINGTVFDSSYKRDPQTTNFRPSQVIKGWTEALTMMPVGSTWELYIPQELAYGERDMGQIPPYSTLIFKVELVDIVTEKADEAPAQPEKASKPASKDVKKKATPAKKNKK